MEMTKYKYVVNYLCDPIAIINADSLEEAKKKFDSAIVIDAGVGAVKSDNKYIEFYLVNEID